MLRSLPSRAPTTFPCPVYAFRSALTGKDRFEPVRRGERHDGGRFECTLFPHRGPCSAGHGCDLIGSIGHELQHAVEVLREARIRSNQQVYHFFMQVGPTGWERFETAEAIRIGLDIAHEACRMT
jgi:hypothetical protein